MSAIKVPVEVSIQALRELRTLLKFRKSSRAKFQAHGTSMVFIKEGGR
jgi:hypothetical protein